MRSKRWRALPISARTASGMSCGVLCSFAGSANFAELAEEEVGSFYLTDFLTRHFERLIIKGLRIDRHPELLPLYFGNYKRVVYLAQTHAPRQIAAAREAAERLGLAFEYRFTGYGDMDTAIVAASRRSRTQKRAALIES